MGNCEASALNLNLDDCSTHISPFQTFSCVLYAHLFHFFHTVFLLHFLGLLDTLFMTGLNDNRWLVKPSESSFKRLECDIVILKVVKSNL